ncbi:MAG: DNA repair protein RecN [Cellvibrionaceae bacterium]|nr:DNA repair protein RecN [Cellvibrionaceae bacterium]
MLTHIHVNNFALVESLDLELRSGLSTITGETGAGKSIMLDALGLALGDRADTDKVRAGCKKCEIQASFDIGSLRFAQRWLEEHDLAAGNECILRRTVTREGRSRAFINGQTVTLQQLRDFGEKLIDIHSQHEHQSLLKTDTHRRLLDEFGKHQALAKDLKNAYKAWQKLEQQRQRARSQTEEMNARYQLLHYQVEELDQLALAEGEIEQLEQEQLELSNIESLRQNSQHVANICSEDEYGLNDRLQQAIQLLTQLAGKPPELDEALILLQNSSIHLAEAQSEIDKFLNSDTDVSRLPEVEARLSDIYQVSRKHRVASEELAELHRQLSEELAALRSGDDQIDSLNRACQQAEQHYQELAQSLSKKRQKSAEQLSKQVNKQLNQLAMQHAKLEVALAPAPASPGGNEAPEFLISTNLGQPPKPLTKVASGGELSRVSLAIQVVTALTSTIPTLVFDEVDVGIGGETGDVVGHLLRQLGESAQVLCVTHLAQVASKSHHHLCVSKEIDSGKTATRIRLLENEARVAEVARMMGGAVDSKKSLAHAKEMVQSAGRSSMLKTG